MTRATADATPAHRPQLPNKPPQPGGPWRAGSRWTRNPAGSRQLLNSVSTGPENGGNRRVEPEIALRPTYLEEELFTRTDLATLCGQAPRLGASIFMPTPTSGAQIRQGPIRLKNLLTQVGDELIAIGLRKTEAAEFLGPAQALVDDYIFWQHQDQGLALFLDSEGLREFRVPLPLTEQVVVGPGFHLRPLLPLLAADGAFQILTMTADRARLYTASRFTCAEVHDADLPAGGDRPTQGRESRLGAFIRHTAAAVQHRLANNPQPLVMVADAETAGLFKKLSGINAFGPLLSGVIHANPESMTRQQLHDAACELMQEHLDAPRSDAEQQLGTLLGRHDPRATEVIGEVIRAAYQGRVATMFLPPDESIWGRYDQEIDQIVTGSEMEQDELLEAAAVQTLQHGGTVHLLAETVDMGPQAAAAVLRY